MAGVTEQYKKLVLDELKEYGSLMCPKKSSWLERKLVRKIAPKKLHPNPQDEFSLPQVGPNYGIINSYEEQIRLNMSHDDKPIAEKLVVEKVLPNGYMLLNGHHRWMAAIQMNLKKVPIEIVNPTHEEDILDKMHRSNKRMCASFDLDEVLLTDGITHEKDKRFASLQGLFFKQMLRKDAGILIRDLQRQGYDVWIYTGNYYSESYVVALFSLYHAMVDGVVSGMKNKKSSERIRNAFREKYLYSVHVDNEGVIVVNNRTKEYDTYDIPKGGNWANEVMTILNKLDLYEQEEGRDGQETET